MRANKTSGHVEQICVIDWTAIGGIQNEKKENLLQKPQQQKEVKSERKREKGKKVKFGKKLEREREEKVREKKERERKESQILGKKERQRGGKN